MNIDSILITGGTGSFGQAFTKKLVENYPHIQRIVIFSRDELKQYEMQQRFPADQYPQLRFFLGDVRDRLRLLRAMEGIEVVIHAAALKQVPAAEYNPLECIKTNVGGAENIVSTSLESGVRRVIALSTDKACAPVNLYGATKLCSDKIFIAANNIKGQRDLGFSVVRYGNVMGSRGSVVPFFLKHRQQGFLPITDFRMTRFHISLDEGIDLVIHAIQRSLGGELFVKKLPSFKVVDLATAIAPECELREIGIRPGEKIHEEMITQVDSLNAIETDDHYVLLPHQQRNEFSRFLDLHQGSMISEPFSYASNNNSNWLNNEQLVALVQDFAGQHAASRL